MFNSVLMTGIVVDLGRRRRNFMFNSLGVLVAGAKHNPSSPGNGARILCLILSLGSSSRSFLTDLRWLLSTTGGEDRILCLMWPVCVSFANTWTISSRVFLDGTIRTSTKCLQNSLGLTGPIHPLDFDVDQYIGLGKL